MTDAFVFDTYAIIEILKGNPAFKKFEAATVVVNHFIFAEVCYYLLKVGQENAEEAAGIYKKQISIISSKQIFDAMVFRHRYKGKKLSTTDCVSYMQAQGRGIPFLTGDMQFEGMPGVEFVR